jgi:hypothetical protein
MTKLQAAATAVSDPAPKVPRAILEDRYDGLLTTRRSITRAGETLQMNGDYNGLRLKLDAIIGRLVEGTTRAPDRDRPLTWNGVTYTDPGSGIINGEVSARIRETIISMVDELGLAE